MKLTSILGYCPSLFQIVYLRKINCSATHWQQMQKLLFHKLHSVIQIRMSIYKYAEPAALRGRTDAQ